MTNIGKSHWLGAGMLALLLHAGLFLTIPGKADSGAVATGSGGLEMSFGPAGGAAGGIPVKPTEVTETKPEETEAETDPVEQETKPVEEIAETVPDVVPEQQVAEIPDQPVEQIVETIPEPVVESVQEVVPVEKVEPVRNVETVPVEVAEKTPEQTKPVEPEPVKAVEKKPEKVVERKPPEVRVKPKQVAKAVAPPKPAPAREAPVQKAEPVKKQASIAGSAGKAGAGQSTATGSSQSASSGGQAGVRRDYFAMILALLDRHKRYPSRERSLRKQGTAHIAFLLHRNGSVSGARIVRSSGRRALDRAALQMLRDAAPLPPVPDAIPDSDLKLQVPVDFTIR
jgi:protein TonB